MVRFIVKCVWTDSWSFGCYLVAPLFQPRAKAGKGTEQCQAKDWLPLNMCMDYGRNLKLML